MRAVSNKYYFRTPKGTLYVADGHGFITRLPGGDKTTVQNYLSGVEKVIWNLEYELWQIKFYHWVQGLYCDQVDMDYHPSDKLYGIYGTYSYRPSYFEKKFPKHLRQ